MAFKRSLRKGYCILLILLTLGCNQFQRWSKPVKLVKNKSYLLGIDGWSVDDLCKKLAGTNGTLDWQVNPDYLKNAFKFVPNSDIVSVVINRGGDDNYGVMVFSVNKNTDFVEFVYGELGDTKISGDEFLIDKVKLELFHLEVSEEYRKKYDFCIPKFKPDDMCIVASNKLNVRSSPNLGDNKIGVLDKGTKVRIIEVIDISWVKINLKNGEGYVASKFLKKMNINNGKSKIRMLIGN